MGLGGLNFLSFNPDRPGYAIHDRVRVDLRDGRRLDSGPIVSVRGDHDLPLRRDELWAKFEDCLAVSGTGMRAERLFDALMRLDELAHVRDLMELMEH